MLATIQKNFFQKGTNFLRCFSAAKGKTEKEKMLSGDFYQRDDPELLKERERAQKLLNDFNNSSVDEFGRRLEILSKLFGTEINNLIEPPFYCKYGTNIHLGKGVFINFNCSIYDDGKVFIDDKALFAPGVCIYTSTFPDDPEQRKELKEFTKPVRIGKYVWLGGNVVVCPGVSIGDNSIIGAGSVVTTDIPANVIAVGNPARVVKQLTPPKTQQ